MFDRCLIDLRPDVNAVVSPDKQNDGLVPVPAGALQIGMFVAALDRPWLDTPFAMQGLLIESVKDIAQMRQYCQYVYIDPLRTVGPLAVRYLPPGSRKLNESAPQASAAAAAPETSPPETSPPRITTAALQTQRAVAHQRFEQLKAALALPDYSRSPSLMQRVFNNFRSMPGAASWLESLHKPDPKIEQELEQLARTLELPPGIRLTFHPDLVSVERELQAARVVYAQTLQVVDVLLKDARAGLPERLEQLNGVVVQMVESAIRNPDALLWLSRLRRQDTNTYGHCMRVAVYMMTLGRHLGFSSQQLEQLCTIGLLLDIGKLRLPREVLQKPGRLSLEEFALVKQHVHLGLQELALHGTFSQEVELGIAQHHERENGQGYPCGLGAGEISVYGRIAAIADTYAALTCERPYAEALSSHDALQTLYEWAGIQFHAPLVEQFARALNIFPVGTLVELNSGEVAVVCTHNREHHLQPRILILTEPDKTPLDEPCAIDLAQQDSRRAQPLHIVHDLPPESYGLSVHDYLRDQEEG
ncbi:MAG: HD-GYP domain-containing protein [Burkholderiaceae bacterium]|nr:MAG: HD-GYP domain-containing protein [Burkholderiaceae bacterium]